MSSHNDLFERVLSVSREDIQLSLRFHEMIPWQDFYLNPRRLRGSDFLMRWSQGQWSEKRIREAVNKTGRYFALPYGPSGVAPEGNVRKHELYFERLEAAGLGKIKRPDLLLFRTSDAKKVAKIINDVGGETELPFIAESDPRIKALLERALMAVECENSLWKAQMMPDFNKELTPQKRLGGRLGLKKAAKLPTVIVKSEDMKPLAKWERANKLPLHIWHVFFDRAYGISFKRIQQLIRQKLIQETAQVFQAPGGATTSKGLYKIYYQYAYKLGHSTSEPKLVADCIVDKNGHILPYVKFQGGRLKLAPEALAELDKLA